MRQLVAYLVLIAILTGLFIMNIMQIHNNHHPVYSVKPSIETTLKGE